MVMGSNSTMCFFPTFTSLPPPSPPPPPPPSSSPIFLLHSTTAQFHFHLRASSSSSSPSTTTNNTKTTRRRSRRLKSDAEICHDIREFLAAVGLPDHHIPSTKELLLHGRHDLANIVRRRGHKQIGELLTSSLYANIASSNMENSFGERPDVADDCEGLLSGQNVKVESLVDDVTASTEVCFGNNSGSLETESTVSLDEGNSISLESLANLSVDNGLGELIDHAEEVNHLAGENLYPTEVAVEDSGGSSLREDFYGNFDNQCSMPTEISGELPFETKCSGNLECEDNLEGKVFGDITSPSFVPYMEKDYQNSFNDSAIDTEDKRLSPLAPSMDSVAHADSSSINLDSLAKLSLEEKVANFIQNGDLDPVEDGDDSQLSKVNFESEPAGVPLSTRPPIDDIVMTLNGSSSTSKHLVPSGTLDQLGDDQLIDQTTNLNKDLDAEVPKVQNESEINYLKFMLYQKELELSRLKEQIEKEKLALSVLQTKAEAEIDKARKLISEKDAELHVAEESLSGLKEVEVEFCGDGDVVEVAGSFNGWHHRIEMDPQPSTSAIDFGGSRRSRFWSTTLWLYPGVYEIKFVVDGHWRIDPQMETVTRGHICNNILRVDR